MFDYDNIRTKLIQCTKELALSQYNLERSEEKNCKLNSELKEYKQLCVNLKKNIHKISHDVDMKKSELDIREKQIANQEKLMKLKVKNISVLAKHIADEELVNDKLRESMLCDKNRPALKAAEVVSEISREKHTLNLRLKEAEYLVKYYEQAAPWLAEAEDDYIDPELNKTGIEDFDENKDAASFWLSKDEFTQLTSQEKYQLALERYKKRAKTKAEIGRDYERYVGYQYETKGYAVEYRGIVDGFEDRGRDLL